MKTSDQAENLRQLIDKLKLKQATNQVNSAGLPKKRSCRIITVTSGKGGVGKTNMTINLALALSEMGNRVTIIDADLGLANIDVLLGISPRYSMVDIIRNKKNVLEVLTEGPLNIKFLSGGSGVPELVKLDQEHLDMFIANITLLDRLSDIILIDTGAGISDSVLSFVLAADEVILVTTPEPTSITDAYALIKMVSNRDKDKAIKVLVNKAETVSEAQEILKKLQIVARKFLKVDLIPLGFVLQDDQVIKAVKMQKPFMLSFPKSQAAKHIKEVSRKLIETKELKTGTDGARGFVNRLVNFLNG